MKQTAPQHFQRWPICTTLAKSRYENVTCLAPEINIILWLNWLLENKNISQNFAGRIDKAPLKSHTISLVISV